MAYTKFPSTTDTNFPSRTGKTNFPTTLLTDFPSRAGKTNFPSSSNITQIWLGFATPPIRAWQSDFGLTLGGTLKATGTTPPAITIAGSPLTSVAPRLEITTLGVNGTAKFRYSADAGATFIESGVTVPTTPFTYAFIGALQGITATFANSTYATDNVYQGTIASWTDQITGSSVLVQATAAAQPVTLIGLNGHVSLKSDGVAVKMTDTTVNVGPPGTTPTFYLFVLRQTGWTAAKVLMGCGNAATQMAIFQSGASPAVVEFNGSIVNSNTGAAINTWVRGEAKFSNGADYLKLGSTTVSGGNPGNTDPAVNFNLFADAPASGFSNIEVMAALVFSSIPSAGELTNFATTINAADMYNSGVTT